MLQPNRLDPEGLAVCILFVYEYHVEACSSKGVPCIPVFLYIRRSNVLLEDTFDTSYARPLQGDGKQWLLFRWSLDTSDELPPVFASILELGPLHSW